MNVIFSIILKNFSRLIVLYLVIFLGLNSYMLGVIGDIRDLVGNFKNFFCYRRVGGSYNGYFDFFE